MLQFNRLFQKPERAGLTGYKVMDGLLRPNHTPRLGLQWDGTACAEPLFSVLLLRQLEHVDIQDSGAA